MCNPCLWIQSSKYFDLIWFLNRVLQKLTWDSPESKLAVFAVHAAFIASVEMTCGTIGMFIKSVVRKFTGLRDEERHYLAAKT